MKAKRPILLHFYLLALMLSCPATTLMADDGRTVYGRIMENIRGLHQSPENAEGEATRWLGLLDGQGAFGDIDYASRAQTNWPPIQHLDRVYAWAKAYASPHNGRNSPELLEAITRALAYWHEAHPTSTNWFMQQIACPQRMGVILILMRASPEGLPPGLEKKLTARMEEEGGRPDQSGSQGTAANKLSIAMHWVYRGCLTQDEKTLAFGVEQAYQPIQLTAGQGIQYDYSYQQHGKQLYIGGYGTALADDISKLAIYTQHTPYALPQEKLGLLGRFIREACIPAIRGRFFLWNVLGRGISREGHLDQAAFAPTLERMALLDPEHAPVYRQSIGRIRGTATPGQGIEPLHTHFRNSDYTLHQRPAYTFDVRMASVHTCRSENGNGENLKGFFLTEGATAIVEEGNEYENIFPVWDWSKIPGTTTPAMEQIPRPGQWEKPGTSLFAGGVSNGIYGVSAYAMDEKQFGINTAARKAWFMFDNEIVCLGAGIRSDSPYRICTTVNQCLLQADVIVQADNSPGRLASGTHQFSRLSWIRHRGIGYFFEAGADVRIENQTRTGNWRTIRDSAPHKPVAKEVLSIWIDHGQQPSDAGYAYIIVPGQPASEPVKRPSDGIRILQNTPGLQAVEHQGLHCMGIVFYRPGTFTCDRFTLEASAGCVLLLSGMDSDEIDIYLSDPSRSQAAIELKTSITNYRLITL
jgi:chondroitin AC lyase